MRVVAVDINTPAEKGGLETGDVLVSVAGKRVATTEQFKQALSNVKAGTKVNVEFMRDGSKKTVRLQV